MNKYRKSASVTAVQLNLETAGIVYDKWGGQQHAKAGDWILDNAGDCYSVDAESFKNTYEEISPGRYIKSAVIWADVATCDGFIETKEGKTNYLSGDYVVWNNRDGTDAYAISADKFESMYEECA